MSKMSLQCIRPYLWFMILHKDGKIWKIWKIKTRYNEIKAQRCSVYKQAKQLLQVTFQISFYFISFSLDPLTQGNSLGRGLGEKTRDSVDSVDSVTRWVSDQTLGEKNNHSVRRPVTRWTVVDSVDGSGGSGLGGRQWTRWVGEFPTKHSARKIIPRSRTWTRWEYANTRSLFNKLGEICRVLGTRSDLWNWLSKFSVLAESLCQGVIRFQKKITEKMRRVPLPYCTVGYWHPTEFKTIRY